ncbi:hypothetical protein MCHI_000088 [Candidatus Magnetoovum chiemensis]|nr:hypothetical protein MCHI_000088 [Candidatus Magnetoovum chiemensis]
MDILAKIESISYTPALPNKSMREYAIEDLDYALSRHAVFLLTSNKNDTYAVSWWVSSKRTRSYPYARVYDTLKFKGKKITIIPICKDEGEDGDRDYLQYDTVSLMSLLQVYVIIGYYKGAVKSSRYRNKITKQRFDGEHIKKEIDKLHSFHSDALHWNIIQLREVHIIAAKALSAYRRIAEETDVKMHSFDDFDKRIDKLINGVNDFLDISRELAKQAQNREALTCQPKERLEGNKAKITIINYIGGHYYLTVDEAEIKGNKVYLIESKHTESKKLPSIGDIKDGLIKMILFTNIKHAVIDGKEYEAIPVLKLTTGNRLQKIEEKKLTPLIEEGRTNNFRIMFNNEYIV